MTEGENELYKKAVRLLVSLVLIISTFSFSNVKAAKYDQVNDDVIIENENIQFIFDYKEKSINIIDKTTGYIWSSCIPQQKLDYSLLNETWRAKVQSLLAFTYTDLEINKGAVKESASKVEEHSINVYKRDNKMIVEFEFTKLNINIIVHFIINENSLDVFIPSDGIIENGKYGLVELEVLPFFGAEPNQSEGYYFYPDGCGAIMEFKASDKSKIKTKKYSWPVYGNLEVDIKKAIENEESNIYDVRLPVYGVKAFDSGFVSVITQGEANSIINLYPSGAFIDINSISSSYALRNLIKMDSIGKKKYDNNLIKTDFGIKYIFLSGESADYNGMANKYRDYLTKNSLIKNVMLYDEMPLFIDVFMGITEDRLLFDKYIKMTTFEETKKIVEALNNNNLKNIFVNLVGWQKNGYESMPSIWPTDRHLGGNSGLKKLLNYINKNENRLYLQVDLIKEAM